MPRRCSPASALLGLALIVNTMLIYNTMLEVRDDVSDDSAGRVHEGLLQPVSTPPPPPPQSPRPSAAEAMVAAAPQHDQLQPKADRPSASAARPSRSRQRAARPPPPPWSSGTRWYDKHFPKLDGTPEPFRTSGEIGMKVSQQQAGRLRRANAMAGDGRAHAAELRARHGRRRLRPQAWDEKDRWWRAVTELQQECRHLAQAYGIRLGAAADEELPRAVRARWLEYECGPQGGARTDNAVHVHVADPQTKKKQEPHGRVIAHGEDQT